MSEVGHNCANTQAAPKILMVRRNNRRRYRVNQAWIARRQPVQNDESIPKAQPVMHVAAQATDSNTEPVEYPVEHIPDPGQAPFVTRVGTMYCAVMGFICRSSPPLRLCNGFNLLQVEPVIEEIFADAPEDGVGSNPIDEVVNM